MITTDKKYAQLPISTYSMHSYASKTPTVNTDPKVYSNNYGLEMKDNMSSKS